MTIARLAALAVTAVSVMANLAAEEGRGPRAGVVVMSPETGVGASGLETGEGHGERSRSSSSTSAASRWRASPTARTSSAQ